MPIVFAKPVVPVNGNDSFTRLLVHSDTTNGSTTAVDSSTGGTTSPHTLTMESGAQHSTTRKKFGATSMRIQAGTQNVSTPDNSDWILGSNDFAIDCWVNFNAFQDGNTLAAQFNGGGISSGKAFLFSYNNIDNSLQVTYSTDGTSNTVVIAGVSSFFPSLNQWYHVAVARDGANLRMFVDGTQTGTTFNIGSDVIFNAATPLRIGTIMVASVIHTPNTLNGYIDEFRLSVGTPRYTGNFTPPSAPYTP